MSPPSRNKKRRGGQQPVAGAGIIAPRALQKLQRAVKVAAADLARRLLYVQARFLVCAQGLDDRLPALGASRCPRPSARSMA